MELICSLSIMKKIILVALSENRCIGKDGQTPWHFPADLRRFKEQTVGQSVIMGRKTYESIGKPLPDRCNIVLSRTISPLKSSPLLVVQDLQEAFSIAENFCGSEIAFVIGGAEIYKLALPYVDELRITLIPGNYSGDTFFPEWNATEWLMTEQESGPSLLKFLIYKRRQCE